jgi:putative MATE family efflux protein
MNTPPEIAAVAASYLRVFLITMPTGFGLFLIRSMLQGVGDSKTALYFQFGSVLLAALLDPLLMFGWGGMPKLGLNGTAWSTVITQAFALFFLIYHLTRKNAPVVPRWPRLAHLGPITVKTLKLGVPAAVQQSLVSFGMVFVTGIVNGFGETATAAFGAASRIDQIAFMPAMTMSMAVSTLAGQNLGAGHPDRVREVFRWGCLLCVSITSVVSAAAFFAPEALLRMFLSDPTVIAIGVSYLRIVAPGYLVFAVVFVSNGIINGAGHTLVTSAFTLFSLWVVRVPVAYYLSRQMGSVLGIWYAILGSFFVSLIVSLTYYASGRWKRMAGRATAMAIANASPAKIFGNETGEA